MKIAIYPGSFDPFTFGHYNVVSSTIDLFDKYYIAVGNNPNKNYLFSLKEREKLIKGIGLSPKVTVVSFENKYLIDFAKELKVDYIVRGIRNQEDFNFETNLQRINEDLFEENNIKTLYYIPDKKYVNYSSSVVKALIGPKNWAEVVKNLVPYPVLLELRKKFNND